MQDREGGGIQGGDRDRGREELLQAAPSTFPTPSRIVNDPGHVPRLASGTHRAPRTASACADPQEQQCAEEECDADECGDERRPPADSVDCFGNDKRPYLPLLLFGSTLVGAIHMLMVQFPIIRELSWGYSIRVFFLCLYALTLGCLMYCVLCDPGKLPKEKLTATEEMPRRCHKMWLFKQPIRRYDHYCRWLTNAVGLLNHREFVLMVAGLFTIGLCGCVVDFILVVLASSEGRHFAGFLLIMHLTYSVMLTLLSGPILRLHITFVSRNELANEYKHNLFYVMRDPTGKAVPVNDLDDVEFNAGLDNDRFEYEPSLILGYSWHRNVGCVSLSLH
ncbi:unnamed protein product [Effrenium voratum]|uniref:Palmitoyltransferase n=1 Tax=Effrenium voratum TaxID=2562239 RepID=A0AA36N0P1_9DINO|nr:unnamed protein product [Effrenium voratum]CAJ1386446.1 unnamed protein product [Effrenium voratum]